MNTIKIEQVDSLFYVSLKYIFKMIIFQLSASKPDKQNYRRKNTGNNALIWFFGKKTDKNTL